MKKLFVSGIGEPSNVLQSRFDEDGYLFFRNALDPGVIEKLRSSWIASLESAHAIKTGDSSCMVNPDSTYADHRIPDRDDKHWQEFASHPSVQQFLQNIFGEPAEFVPVVEYRAQPPASEKSGSRTMFWHTDYFFNPGIPYRTLWIPLCDIDWEMGGLALLPNLNQCPALEAPYPEPTQMTPIMGIAQDHPALNLDNALTADFHPTDIVIFHRRTPHTGIANWSDKLRLSMDIRFTLKSEEAPLVGPIISSDPDRLEVKNSADGHIESVTINDSTLIRENATRIPTHAYREHFLPGTDVIVTRKDGIARLLVHVHPPEIGEIPEFVVGAN